MKRILSVLIGLLVFSGCANDTEKLVPRPDDTKAQSMDLNPIDDTYKVQLDILFVVDDSGSMSTHQATLANNIGEFIKAFGGAGYLDYHLGVITSSVERAGELTSLGGVKWVEASTPDGTNVFQQNLLVGTSGSGTEMFFDPIYLALTSPTESTYNKGFFRPQGYLAIVILTDAEDQSTTIQDPLKIVSFLNTLKGGDPDKLVTYGAIIPGNPGDSPPQNCSPDQYDLWPPWKLMAFFKETKGVYFSLCDTTWGQKLAAMGSDLLEHVSKKIPLKKKPFKDIVLTYGSQIIPNDKDRGWTYDAQTNSLRLGRLLELKPEPAGTPFRVRFVPADIN